MLTNRLVRALIGAVVAQASVAAAWYVYKKEQELLSKEDKASGKDKSTPSEKTHDLTPAIEEVASYVQAKEDLKNVTVQEPGKEDKPKVVRKPKAAKKVPSEKTVAAVAEAEEIVKEKKSRRASPVTKEMFVSPEVTAKPARKRTPAKKAETAVVTPTETKKPARKRTPAKKA